MAFQVNDGLSEQDKAFLNQGFQQLGNRMFDPKTQYENQMYEQQRQQLVQRQKLDELVSKGYVDQQGNVSPEGQAFLTQSVYQRPILGRIQQMFGGSPQMTTRGQQMGLNPMAGPQQMNLAPEMGPVNLPSPSQNINQLGIPQSAQTMGQIFGQNGGDLSPEQRTNMAPILRMFGGQRLSEIPAAFQGDILPNLKQPTERARIPKQFAIDRVNAMQGTREQKDSMLRTIMELPGDFLEQSQFNALTSTTNANKNELNKGWETAARDYVDGKIGESEFKSKLGEGPKADEQFNFYFKSRQDSENKKNAEKNRKESVLFKITSGLKRAAILRKPEDAKGMISTVIEENRLSGAPVKISMETFNNIFKEGIISKALGNGEDLRQMAIDGGLIEEEKPVFDNVTNQEYKNLGQAKAKELSELRKKLAKEKGK